MFWSEISEMLYNSSAFAYKADSDPVLFSPEGYTAKNSIVLMISVPCTVYSKSDRP